MAPNIIYLKNTADLLVKMTEKDGGNYQSSHNNIYGVNKQADDGKPQSNRRSTMMSNISLVKDKQYIPQNNLVPLNEFTQNTIVKEEKQLIKKALQL